jgi:hypothetical protein
MSKLFTLLLFSFSCLLNQDNKISDPSTMSFSIDILQPVCSISENPTRLNVRMVVSCTNKTDRVIYVSNYMFSYKEYRDQDYYLEALDSNGKPTSIIRSGTDIDWIIDREIIAIQKGNSYVDTLNVNIYQFRPGKYKVRWVYDPTNHKMKENEKIKFAPAYSNWADLLVVP